MNAEKLALIDADGNAIADLQVTCEASGWFTGTVLSQRFPAKLQAAVRSLTP